MPLLGRGETVRVALPAAGEWVEVKARPSVGDVKAIESTAKAFRLRVSGEQVAAVRAAATEEEAAAALKGMELPLDPEMFERMAFVVLERAIVAWSFAEPVTPENIRQLDEASYDAIRASLDRLWAKERPEEEKNG